VKTKFHYGWLILGMAVLVVFGSLGLTRFGYGMVLPEMKVGLDIDSTGAGGIATASLVGYLALSVLGGILASRFGPRIVITIGLAIAALGMILTGFSNQLATATASQLLAGIGSGASNVPVMALLASWFAPRRLGFASGIAVLGSSLGLIFTGSVTPVIMDAYDEDGWRMCWFIFGSVTAVLAIAAFLLLRNSAHDMGLKHLGSLNSDPIPTLRRTSLQWGKVYRSRIVWQIGLVYIAFGLSYIIYMTFFKDQLLEAGSYSEDAASHLYMIMGFVSLVCGIWGFISDRIGRKYTLMILYGIHAIAFILFGVWTETPGFTISIILFGFSAWSIPAVVTAASGETLGGRLAPAALGFITLFFGVGQMLGPVIAGTMSDAADTYLPAYLLAGGVALLGAFGALFLHTPTSVEK